MDSVDPLCTVLQIEKTLFRLQLFIGPRKRIYLSVKLLLDGKQLL
jgi:hypothetical protein